MKPRHFLRLLVLLLAGCAAPPPSAYVGGQANPGTGLALGRDAAGESCAQLSGTSAAGVEIFCGGWTEPAARVERGGPVGESPAALAALAKSGPWREALDQRFACAEPASTRILDGAPALVLSCSRRVGGWPQVALVAAVRGQAYLADGIAPTLGVMERSIGVLSGLSPRAAAALPPSEADTLLAHVLAAHAFTAGDAAQYQRLMALGARANLAENFAAAELAYRAALALQQRALGRDDPNTADALMHLALQISDQGRYPEAAALFRRAEALAPLAADRTVPARLLHYRALDALNQGHDAAALALLTQAGAAYAALLPPAVVAGTAAPAGADMLPAAASVPGASGLALGQAGLAGDPTAQSALIGLIETWRYRAIALSAGGDLPGASAALARAQALARAGGMEVPLVTARLQRTAAVTDAARGRLGTASARLAQAESDFGSLLPGTRPVAETRLLQGAAALRQGDPGRAVGLCRAGAKLLRQLEVGTRPELLAPCLSAFAAEAARDPARREALHAEMFETAELGQDSVTSRQIAEAAARLAVHARDPRVAAAIRRHQDAARRLDILFRQRDALAHGPASGVAPAASLPQTVPAVDAAIASAESDLAQSGAALQEAAPNYRQLVQLVVPASSVLKALAPGEAFVAIVLARDGGWTFLLRDGRIHVAQVRVPRARLRRLVLAVRGSIEPDDHGRLPRFEVADDRAIYQAVLASVAAELKGASDLVVAPSGPLLAIPFGLLLTGPAQADALGAAPWLIRQMPISHVPAAANFVALRKLVSGSHAPRPWFGFGDPRPVTPAQAQQRFPLAACADSARLFAGLPRLPFALRELTAARALLGGAPRDQLVGADFTAAAVARLDLKRYRVLHFATHALLPAELRCESEPAIVTSAPAGARSAAGALLTANRVLGLSLDANAVILSACNSGGIGGHPAGESLSALARAFFFAGARALLVTHWAISDQASAFLVAETLRGYAAGRDGGLAGALRAAQLTMINGAGHNLPASLADPFFWAPFALVGEGRVGAEPTAAGTAQRAPRNGMRAGAG